MQFPLFLTVVSIKKLPEETEKRPSTHFKKRDL